jgi:CBS-domain-containing membrane protein
MTSGPEPKQFSTSISEEDVLDAMKSMGSYLDITPGDFREIYQVAYRHAIERLNQSIKAKHVMKKIVVSVPVDAPLEKVSEVMAAHRISGVPVIGANQQILGVISERDFLREITDTQDPSPMHFVERCLKNITCSVESLRSRTARDIMTAPAITLGGEASLAQIAGLLRVHGINRVPIIDDRQRVIGIVTRSDIVHAYCTTQP